jgi:hypothetical protein
MDRVQSYVFVNKSFKELQLCKGDAVNFGGWDEFTKKNGLFEFPNGKS